MKSKIRKTVKIKSIVSYLVLTAENVITPTHYSISPGANLTEGSARTYFIFSTF